MENMKLIAFINSRSGSKGIPNKNIKKLNNKPLIQWTIELAKSIKLFDKIVVSTDSSKIAKIALKYGAEVPFLRPKKLSGDNISGVEPVIHFLKKFDNIDNIALLQPTSPIRSKKEIELMLKNCLYHNIKSAVSLCNVSEHPELLYSIKSNGKLRKYTKNNLKNRQKFKKLFRVNGSIYFANVRWLLKHKQFITNETYGFIMNKVNSIDIDDMFDWKIASLFLKKYK